MQSVHKTVSTKSRRYCSVPQCCSYGTGDTSLHFFPKNPELCRKWQEILKIGKPISKFMLVCSKHFVENDFMPVTPLALRRRLKPNVVPSQNLPVKRHNKRQSGRVIRSRKKLLNDKSILEPHCIILEPHDESNIEPQTSVDALSEWEGEEYEKCTDSKDSDLQTEYTFVKVEELTIPSTSKSKHNTNCCVPGCHSRKGTNRNIHFHYFPTKTDRVKVKVVNESGMEEIISKRIAWARALSLRKPITDSMRVCSKHFYTKDYVSRNKSLKQPKLRLTVVPSRNLPSTNGLRLVDKEAEIKTPREARLKRRQATKEIKNENYHSDSETLTMSTNSRDDMSESEIEILVPKIEVDVQTNNSSPISPVPVSIAPSSLATKSVIEILNDLDKSTSRSAPNDNPPPVFVPEALNSVKNEPKDDTTSNFQILNSITSDRITHWPRYVGDCTDNDMTNPKKARVMVWVAVDKIAKQRRSMKKYKALIKRTSSELECMKSLLLYLRNNNFISQFAERAAADSLPRRVAALLKRPFNNYKNTKT